jgi:hypothetical protein
MAVVEAAYESNDHEGIAPEYGTTPGAPKQEENGHS